MHKTLVLGIFLFLHFLMSLPLVSQIELYHRVKISATQEDYKNLSSMGIAVDHGEHSSKNYLITELSDSELKKVMDKGFNYEILIQDVSSYYVKRNSEIATKQGLFSSSACKDCPGFQTPQNFNLGSMGGFYTYQELLSILDSMASKFPNLISTRQALSTTLTTWDGRPVYYVKISDNVTLDEPENELLYTSLHHAREVQSLSQLVFYMWYLLENYGTNPEVTYLVDNLEIYFVPCLNPDGYIYNETINPNGGGMWRKNRRPFAGNVYGVDLNRNYGFNWGFDDFGSSPDSTTDVHRGPYPFSEPETQMIRDFCNQHQFQLAVNNHTYSNLLIYPWGYQAGTYTPDSAVFAQYAQKMVQCSGFTYGTADQTVGYVVNGSSDDWMYGEQNTKPKIFSMTPEAGNSQDGFWPAINRIVDISKTTMEQNLYAARLCTKFAEIDASDNFFVSAVSFYQKFKLKRMGSVTGNFTISGTPISSNISSFGNSIVISNPLQFQSVIDSIQINLSPSISAGDIVSFLLSVNNGTYTISDTVNLVYGSPVIAFSDNGNSLGQWQFSGGTWINSTSQFVTPTSSITDSPQNYANNINKSITTLSTINLTDALAAELSFYSKWDIETNYDYAQVSVSANNGPFVPLCGTYTKTGDVNQDFGNPVYDGLKSTWVKESIDLGAFIGQNIKLKFSLVSDFYQTGDGIYLDDIMINKVISPNGFNEITNEENNFSLFPNPANETIFIKLNDKRSSENVSLKFVDLTGRVIFYSLLNSQSSQVELSLNEFKTGFYFAEFYSGSRVIKRKKFQIIR